MSHNFSLHEHYRDVEPTEAGGNRAFGCTVGSIAMVIGAAKAFAAGAVTPVAGAIFAVGALLLLLGIVAPALLATPNRLWLKLGNTIAKIVNPVLMALIFFLVITPMAFVMRRLGKRPLSLAPSRSAASYWIQRRPADHQPSSMKQQF